jgi:hypothetical protein
MYAAQPNGADSATINPAALNTGASLGPPVFVLFYSSRQSVAAYAIAPVAPLSGSTPAMRDARRAPFSWIKSMKNAQCHEDPAALPSHHPAFAPTTMFIPSSRTWCRRRFSRWTARRWSLRGHLPLLATRARNADT